MARDFHNILVTGGCGFIGINFIQYILSNESNFTGRIINVDKLSYASVPKILNKLAKERYVFIKKDIKKEKSIGSILNKFHIDAVCHLAAETHVDRSIQNPKIFMQNNIMGTLSLLEAIRKTNPSIHFHQVSTDEVFGSLQSNDQLTFTETSPFNPSNPYSVSKASSDHLVRSYHNTYNISVTVSNSTNNYGYYQHREKFIPNVIYRIQKKKTILLYGDGSHKRDWIHVRDHAKAIWLVMQQGKNGSSYNIGAKNEWSNKNLLHLLCNIISQKTHQNFNNLISLIHHTTDRPGHDYRYGVDTSKIEQTLGWIPSISFEKGLSDYVSWCFNK